MRILIAKGLKSKAKSHGVSILSLPYKDPPTTQRQLNRQIADGTGFFSFLRNIVMTYIVNYRGERKDMGRQRANRKMMLGKFTFCFVDRIIIWFIHEWGLRDDASGVERCCKDEQQVHGKSFVPNLF